MPPDLDLFGFPAGGVAAPRRQPFLNFTFVAGGGSHPPLRFQIWKESEDKEMGAITKNLSDESQTIGQRWASALRARYPGPAIAKQVARAFAVDLRTAEAWLSGQAPYAKFLLRGWRLHGAAIIAETLAPESDWAKASSVEAALGEIEAKLADLGDDLARLRIERGPP